nr:hypothetical protein [Variovorax paradoxus]
MHIDEEPGPADFVRHTFFGRSDYCFRFRVGTFKQRANSYLKSNLLDALFVLCFDQVPA